MSPVQMTPEGGPIAVAFRTASQAAYERRDRAFAGARLAG
jgi:hypothetical protein